MRKISKFRSVLGERCPRCRRGSLFVHHPYKLSGFDKMHRQCPHCHLDFEIEPGFYTGAMYVSYAFSVALFFFVGLILYVFFRDPGLSVYVLITLMVVVLLFPLLYRYSRVVYLHLFGGVKYDPFYEN